MRRFAALVLGLGVTAHAEEAPPFHIGMAFGWMDTDGAGGESGSGPYLGVSGGSRRGKHLALEGDIAFQVLDYPIPPNAPPVLFGSLDDLDLTSATTLFVAKGLYPLGRFVPYIGAGAGLTFARMELTGDLLGYVGTFDEEEDFTTALAVLAGFEIGTRETNRFGFEYRWIDSEASFGDLTGGEVDIGGGAVTFCYRWRLP